MSHKCIIVGWCVYLLLQLDNILLKYYDIFGSNFSEMFSLSAVMNIYRKPIHHTLECVRKVCFPTVFYFLILSIGIAPSYVTCDTKY